VDISWGIWLGLTVTEQPCKRLGLKHIVKEYILVSKKSFELVKFYCQRACMGPGNVATSYRGVPGKCKALNSNHITTPPPK
jgi:hypothetical protein